jgi:YD repeat-containing protein
VHYTYSPTTGDLDAVHDLEGNLFSFGYDEAGRLASVSKPGGLTETYSWDEDVRLTGIRLSGGGARGERLRRARGAHRHGDPRGGNRQGAGSDLRHAEPHARDDARATTDSAR